MTNPDDVSGAGSRAPVASDDTLYADLFNRYTRNTDGKNLLAEAILNSQPRIRRERLLDLGAGDGILTGHLAKAFREVIAVEKNHRFLPALQAIPNCTAIHGRIEDYAAPESFDLILFSYSLTGVEPAQLAACLRRMMSVRTSGGRLLACTFDDECPWARFANRAAKVLGVPLRGGTAHYRSLIESAGLRVGRVRSVSTSIWDESLAKLTELMAFFFASSHDDYVAKFDEIQATLATHSTEDAFGARTIHVRENVYELHPQA